MSILNLNRGILIFVQFTVEKLSIFFMFTMSYLSVTRYQYAHDAATSSQMGDHPGSWWKKTLPHIHVLSTYRTNRNNPYRNPYNS